MTQDNGASLRDRAVVNGAGQAVSAVPASVPSAARILGWQDPIWFGKYAGLLVREVAGFNPQYLAWAVTNLDRFDLTPEARKLGQQQLNLHRQQSSNRQNGWAWGFGSAVKSAAQSWRSKLIRLELDARRAAEARAAQGIAARSDKTGTGLAEGKSPVAEANHG